MQALKTQASVFHCWELLACCLQQGLPRLLRLALPADHHLLLHLVQLLLQALRSAPWPLQASPALP
jgi:hypothetical protein